MSVSQSILHCLSEPVPTRWAPSLKIPAMSRQSKWHPPVLVSLLDLVATFLALGGFLAFPLAAKAQQRPYIGFAYPAGGQTGTVFQVRLGGQGLEDVNEAFVTGSGVTAKVIEYRRALNPQEITLLREQLRVLKRAETVSAPAMMVAESQMMASDDTMMARGAASGEAGVDTGDEVGGKSLIDRIEDRISNCVNRPASVALANLVYLEVSIAHDAAPGRRELRLATHRGVSNPLVFEVGQLPEVCRKPMVTAPYQVLGKEELALRKRPADEMEDRVTVPCTLNGQVASGEVNRYRFNARQGQRLVIRVQARRLIPYIADAVPGWFQPVLALRDAGGKEVAYADDYRFKPDPVILFHVPRDGEYLLDIYDAIYRGREDFVYRITIGETPFITSVFPLGTRTNAPVAVTMKGWNLATSTMEVTGEDVGPGIYYVAVTNQGLVSNPLPFAVDTLPEADEQEPNNTPANAQMVDLPVIVNGRSDRADDWDVFEFTGKSNEAVVAEVYARRLDSPLDSVLKLYDAHGKLLAFCDDMEDAGAGINTHHADSWVMVTLPADGKYYVHVGDTARHFGEEYGYRLRLSAPRPDFELRVTPSSAALRSKGTAPLDVHVIRKDGFDGPIKLALKDPPAGFSANPATLSGTQTVARLTVRTSLIATTEPVNLSVTGSARIGNVEVAHQAVPAEDRMQAFLWRHLVPASELKALVYDPKYQPPPKRIPRQRPPSAAEPKPTLASNSPDASKPTFTKRQVASRLRQLRLLYEEGLLTDDFNDEKVAECEAAQ